MTGADFAGPSGPSDREPGRPADPGAVVTPYPDGPLLLRGDFVITTVDGEPIPAGRRTVALCRCGRSGRKPFCDGSHVQAGFRARDRGSVRGPAPEDSGRGGGPA
jgi:CDGSH-type Zn-finger protein